MAQRWAHIASTQQPDKQKLPAVRAIPSVGSLLARAYPSRIAKNRGADRGFLLANGRGALLDPASPLSREPFLAVGEVSGGVAHGRIVLAAPLTSSQIEAEFADRIVILERESHGVKPHVTCRAGRISAVLFELGAQVLGGVVGILR